MNLFIPFKISEREHTVVICGGVCLPIPTKRDERMDDRAKQNEKEIRNKLIYKKREKNVVIKLYYGYRV